ncbi:MAG: hypothetical protein JWO35_453 [Candidatus Saccharibacteria bacterium]|nr:hypothetical protein [Candidatus Saccharibacteria bacterium]
MQNDTSPNGSNKKTLPSAKTPSVTATTRINLTISKQLLTEVDKAAEHDYTTRSDIIRTALLSYLRPQGRELDHLDPDTIYDALKRRHMLASVKKLIKETENLDPYDT